MLVTLVSNSCPQVIHPPRPPKVLGLQVHSFTLSAQVGVQWAQSRLTATSTSQVQKFKTSLTNMVKPCLYSKYKNKPGMVMHTCNLSYLGGHAAAAAAAAQAISIIAEPVGASVVDEDLGRPDCITAVIS
ncbi:Myosin regulatory light chain 10 [Plecturocebus cupreus]